jgi:hypothetical protein
VSKTNINESNDFYTLNSMMTSITIIGHRGYIGSFLHISLCQDESSAGFKIAHPLDGQKGKDVDVSESDVVIYLCGVSGHEKCAKLTER